MNTPADHFSAVLQAAGPRHVLLATELGAGMGHFAPWATAVSELLAAGCQVSVAAFDVDGAFRYLVQPYLQGNAGGGQGTKVPHLFQAPSVKRPTSLPQGAAQCWPDIPLGLGYGEPHAWAAALVVWRQMLLTLQPSEVWADHAPSALLAAAECGVRMVEVGTGFCVPPALCPMPALPTSSPSAAHLKASDERLTQSANQALAIAGYALRLPSVCGIFNLAIAGGGERRINSPAALDHYAPTRAADPQPVRFTGLPGQAAPGLHRQLPTPSGYAVLGYLKPNTPQLANVLAAVDAVVTRAGVRARLLVPGWQGSQFAGVEVLAQPEPLASLLSGARCFITNGGLHGVGQAIEAGAYVLALPMHVEQAATVANLQANRWGEPFNPQALARALQMAQADAPANVNKLPTKQRSHEEETADVPSSSL